MSVIAFGILAAFVLVLVVLAVARRTPRSRRGADGSLAIWASGSDSSYSGGDSSSSCDSGSSDGGSCDGGGSH
jgi:hypothetical protein